MIANIKNILRRPYRKLQQIFGQIDFVPSGHFYSPIANDFEINEGIKNINYNPDSLYGIDLRVKEQLKILEIFKGFYNEMPFQDNKTKSLRYYFDNNAYCHSDGICLYSMMRYLQPKRIIEIGSGFSLALMYDVRDRFFTHKWGGCDTSQKLEIIHIEPYPKLLQSLLNENDVKNLNLYAMRLQDVPLSVFDELYENDILFVDSTHISKINSDVNKVFFEILPRLKSGVYIHFHDIFYPFTYPKDWLLDKNSWNETYLLRAFLQYNNQFEIVFFNTCINHLYPDDFAQALPLSQKNTGGSIWLRKR